MANIADITVKKNDGTTDIVWTGLIGSGGDKIPAVWRSDTVGFANAFRPTFEFTAQNNVPKTVRYCDLAMRYPQLATDTTTGLVSIINTGFAAAKFTLPQQMTGTDINELISQFSNLVNSALIRSQLKLQAGPT